MIKGRVNSLIRTFEKQKNGDTKQLTKSKPESRSSKMPELSPNAGISLRYFRELMANFRGGTFYDALNGVKDMTQRLPPGNQSLLQLVASNPETNRFVQSKAEVFISYAWGGNLGETLDAIARQHENKDVFIWIDFVCVDQHQFVGQVDFQRIASAFKRLRVRNVLHFGFRELILPKSEV
jgi:hypothetical protein